uniref:Uncharacterized protein n=1 Tax=viral metagenome TaxID=1070528 RepID=A0A6C0J8W6_9ZZZZ
MGNVVVKCPLCGNFQSHGWFQTNCVSCINSYCCHSGWLKNFNEITPNLIDVLGGFSDNLIVTNQPPETRTCYKYIYSFVKDLQQNTYMIHRFGVNNSDKTFLNRLYIHHVNKRTYRDIDNKHNKYKKKNKHKAIPKPETS